MTYLVDLMNKQYYLREGKYMYNTFIYIHNDEGFARFGILCILICYCSDIVS